jgi:hypothetical protein
VAYLLTTCRDDAKRRASDERLPGGSDDLDETLRHAAEYSARVEHHPDMGGASICVWEARVGETPIRGRLVARFVNGKRLPDQG